MENGVSIIYEDENILAVNKPSGLLVHRVLGEGEEKTLVGWVLSRYPHMEKVGEPLKLSSGEIINRAGIVHRLDRETSGIVLIAKTQESFLSLKKQFQEHTIKKTYYAIVEGRPKENEGTIDKPLGRSARDPRRRSTLPTSRGKKRDAITNYRYRASSEDKQLSFLEVYPLTGRTHQIRVHLKAIGNPVLCDKLYAPKQKCPSELGRLGLHAFAIEFKNQNGTNLRLEAPLPKDFSQVLKTLFGKLEDI